MIRLLGSETIDQKTRSRVGVQLQTTGLLSHLRVVEQVELFRGLFPKALPVDEIMELVGLKEMAKKATKTLSPLPAPVPPPGPATTWA